MRNNAFNSNEPRNPDGTWRKTSEARPTLLPSSGSSDDLLSAEKLRVINSLEQDPRVSDLEKIDEDHWRFRVTITGNFGNGREETASDLYDVEFNNKENDNKTVIFQYESKNISGVYVCDPNFSPGQVAANNLGMTTATYYMMDNDYY